MEASHEELGLEQEGHGLDGHAVDIVEVVGNEVVVGEWRCNESVDNDVLLVGNDGV